MDLVLIRHPAVAVPPGVCYGASDVPLAGDCADGARAALDVLAALRLGAPATVHASPLTRCASVAARLAAHFGCPLRLDVRLSELDFGAWEMRAWDEIERAEIDAWAADVEHARPHGGESVAMLTARARAWLDEARRAPPADGIAVALTHAGVMRALRGWDQPAPPFGAAMVVRS